MGARQYSPLVGRFLQVDPIKGGNANDYTYVGDPINQFDLNGQQGSGSFCYNSHSAAYCRKHPGANSLPTKPGPGATSGGDIISAVTDFASDNAAPILQGTGVILSVAALTAASVAAAPVIIIALTTAATVSLAASQFAKGGKCAGWRALEVSLWGAVPGVGTSAFGWDLVTEADASFLTNLAPLSNSCP